MTVQFSFVWADSEKSKETFLRKTGRTSCAKDGDPCDMTNLELRSPSDTLRSLMSYPRSQAQKKVRGRGIEVGTSLRHDVCLLDYRSCTNEVKRKQGMPFVVAIEQLYRQPFETRNFVRFWFSLCMLDYDSEVSA